MRSRVRPRSFGALSHTRFGSLALFFVLFKSHLLSCYCLLWAAVLEFHVLSHCGDFHRQSRSCVVAERGEAADVGIYFPAECLRHLGGRSCSGWAGRVGLLLRHGLKRGRSANSASGHLHTTIPRHIRTSPPSHRGQPTECMPEAARLFIRSCQRQLESPCEPGRMGLPPGPPPQRDAWWFAHQPYSTGPQTQLGTPLGLCLHPPRIHDMRPLKPYAGGASTAV